MKILWIIHGYPPILNAGAELYTHNLNKYLISQGHQISVLMPKNYSYYENKSMTYEGVKIHALDDGEKPDDLVAWSDIVMTHLDHTPMTINCVNNTRPVVWVAHNTFFEYYKYLNDNSNVSIIYNSHAMESIGKKYFKNSSFVLRPIITLSKKHSAKKPDPAANKYITLINLNENKGGLFLSELANAMPNREFLGVTGGYEKQIEQPRNVKVVQHTANIQEIYDQTRLILMPSFYESWGMVASEAMINGIPVIANRTFGLEENLSTAGIFCPLQVLKWKYAIQQLDTPCVYETHRDKCLVRAEEQKEFNKLEMRDCMFYLEMIVKDNSKKFWDNYYTVVSTLCEKAYVLNLDMDINKYINMTNVLNVLNLDYNSTFVSAKLGNTIDIPTLKKSDICTDEMANRKRGEIGCNYTQYTIFQDAYEKKYNKIIIFEDDISLTDNFFNILFNCKNINNDGLVLGHKNHDSPHIADERIYTKKYDNLYKLNDKNFNFGGFYAVILNKIVIDYIHHNWNPFHTISDVYLRELACKFNIYYIQPVIVNVEDSNIKPSLTNQYDVISGVKHLNLDTCKKQEKIQRIHFKLKHNTPIIIYCYELAKKYSLHLIIRVLKNIYNSLTQFEFTQSIEKADIIFIHYCEQELVVHNGLSILINGESSNDKNLNFDIYIESILESNNYFHIHYPEIFQCSMDKFLTNNFKLLFPYKNVKEKFCVYMYRYDIPHQVNYFKLLSQYKHVDALGKLMNNVIRENDDNSNWKDNAINLYSNYKFVLALENVKKDGYATEKLLLPLFANSIPIYYGASDIFKYINKKRVIYIDDYKTDESLLNYITKLDNNDILYNTIVNEDWFTPNYSFESITNVLLDERIKNILGFTPRDIYLKKNPPNNEFIKKEVENNLTFYHDYSIDNEFLLKKSILDWCNPHDNIIIKNSSITPTEPTEPNLNNNNATDNNSFFSKKILFFTISIPFISYAIYLLKCKFIFDNIL